MQLYPKEQLMTLSNQEHEKIVHWAKPPQGITLEKAVEGGWPLSKKAYLYVEGDLVTT